MTFVLQADSVIEIPTRQSANPEAQVFRYGDDADLAKLLQPVGIVRTWHNGRWGRMSVDEVLRRHKGWGMRAVTYIIMYRRMAYRYFGSLKRPAPAEYYQAVAKEIDAYENS